MNSQRRSYPHISRDRRLARINDVPKTITVPNPASRSSAAHAHLSKNATAALVLAFCLASVVQFSHILSPVHERDRQRRSLLSSLYLSAHSTLMPWAHHHLVDVTEAPDPSRETALFWHIPKSGGTTAKRLYQCMGQTLAHRVGADPRFGHDKDSEIVVFEPHAGKDWKVVNVDTTVRAGIIKASKMGLIKSHTADLVSGMHPWAFVVRRMLLTN